LSLIRGRYELAAVLVPLSVSPRGWLAVPQGVADPLAKTSGPAPSARNVDDSPPPPDAGPNVISRSVVSPVPT